MVRATRAASSIHTGIRLKMRGNTMLRRSFVRIPVILVTAAALVFGSASVASAASSDSGTVSISDTAAALDQTADLVATAQPSATDNDSAAQTVTADIPVDPKDGIKLKGRSGRALTVNLPHSDRSGRGYRSRRGIVAYAGQDSSANAVVPTTDGAQFLTTIKGHRAPSTYTYDLQMTGGTFVHIQPDGSAVVIGQDGKSGYTVAKPWAKDADGNEVPTHYTTDGNSLTQVVDHRSGDYTYPIVADPSYHWWWGGVDVYMSRWETSWGVAGGAGAITALFTGPYLVAFGLGLLQNAFQSAWRQNKCIVAHYSWVRPSYISLYSC